MAIKAHGERRPITRIRVNSKFFRPLEGEEMGGKTYRVEGVAWAGEGKIAKFELRVDEWPWQPAISPLQLWPWSGHRGAMNGKSPVPGNTRWRFAQPTTKARANLKFATLIEKIPTNSTLLIASVSVFG